MIWSDAWVCWTAPSRPSKAEVPTFSHMALSKNRGLPCEFPSRLKDLSTACWRQPGLFPLKARAIRDPACRKAGALLLFSARGWDSWGQSSEYVLSLISVRWAVSPHHTFLPERGEVSILGRRHWSTEIQICKWNILTLVASLVAQLVKNLPALWETQVQSLGWEDPLEKGMLTHSHSSILAWKIPWSHKGLDTTDPDIKKFTQIFLNIAGQCQAPVAQTDSTGP